MNTKEFIELLKYEEYYDGIEGGMIIVNYHTDIHLSYLITMPSDVKFINDGNVYLGNLQKMPNNVSFNNTGIVSLNSLNNISTDVKFNNKGGVYLGLLDRFNTNGRGKWIRSWGGNIVSIDSKRLLNLMISKGLFI